MKISYNDRDIQLYTKDEYRGLGFGKEAPDSLEDVDYDRIDNLVPTMFMEDGKLAYIHIPAFSIDMVLEEINREDDYFKERFDVPKLELEDVNLIEVLEEVERRLKQK